MTTEFRSAPRVQVRIPTLIEKVGQQPVSPDMALAPYYERVVPDGTAIGMKAPGVVLDLSANGAFIAVAAEAFPLLSRLELTFPLAGFGQVEAIGWVMWRRTADVPIDIDGIDTELPAGVGVLFEAISIDARQAIAARVVAVAPSGNEDHDRF